MADKRRRPRAGARLSLTLRSEVPGAFSLTGFSENFSERGAMLSLSEDEAELQPGARLTITLDLPTGACTVSARVRWTSKVLPGMTGVEFQPPVPTALAEYIRVLLDTTADAEAV